MTLTENLIDDAGFLDRLKIQLFTDLEFSEQFEALLNRPGLSDHSYRFAVTSLTDEEIVVYASNDIPIGPSNESRDLSNASLAVKCRCDAWRRTSTGYRGADVNTIISHLTALIHRHWGERDPATTLPFLKNPGTSPRFVKHAQSHLAAGAVVGILHTDLDKFKEINTEFHETGGNAVLQEFARRIRVAFSNVGLVVRTAGDEFSAVLHHDSAGPIIQAVEAFRHQMEIEPFGAISRPNTCSIGLSLYRSGEDKDFTSEDSILFDARAAEERAKLEGRNRIALLGPRPSVGEPITLSASDLAGAALEARTKILRNDGEAIKDVVLDRLSAEFEGASKENLSGKIKTIKETLGLLIGSFQLPDKRPDTYLGVFSPLDWATLVGRALLRATLRSHSPLGPSDKIFLSIDRDGQLIIRIECDERRLDIELECWVEPPSPPIEDAIVGACFYLDGSCPVGGINRLNLPETDTGACDPFSSVLLLPIGDASAALCEQFRGIVAAIVDIDDRPVRGGGLPDFWQSNLSRVIRACLSNPNIEKIVAVGEGSSAQNTIANLKGSDTIDYFELQRRLSVPVDKLRAFFSRKIDVLLVEARAEAALQALQNVVENCHAADFTERPYYDLKNEATRRRLRMAPPDDSNRLTIADGFRAKTLADAYPEAIQLIRGAVDELTHVEVSKRSFRELSGFKIVLTNPLGDPIPDYWREDKGLLDAYYKDNFSSPEGLFGARLNSSFGESESIIAYAVNGTVDAVIHQQPTRRINVPIVPDQLEHPLGLSMIQIFPRSQDGEWHLDFIWVWRTVDALVGFPFSAYGSILWTRDFLKRVQSELAANHSGHTVEIGELTYIALSFHMYLHDGDQEIARAIVQDASD